MVKSVRFDRGIEEEEKIGRERRRMKRRDDHEMNLSG